MGGYGHAAGMLAGTPLGDLRVATAKLKLWADLNPKLMPLYLEFLEAQRKLELELDK